MPSLHRLAATLDDMPVAPLHGGVEAVTLRHAVQSVTSISNSLARTFDGAVAATAATDDRRPGGRGRLRGGARAARGVGTAVPAAAGARPGDPGDHRAHAGDRTGLPAATCASPSTAQACWSASTSRTRALAATGLALGRTVTATIRAALGRVPDQVVAAVQDSVGAQDPLATSVREQYQRAFVGVTAGPRGALTTGRPLGTVWPAVSRHHSAVGGGATHRHPSAGCRPLLVDPRTGSISRGSSVALAMPVVRPRAGRVAPWMLYHLVLRHDDRGRGRLCRAVPHGDRVALRALPLRAGDHVRAPRHARYRRRGHREPHVHRRAVPRSPLHEVWRPCPGPGRARRAAAAGQATARRAPGRRAR